MISVMSNAPIEIVELLVARKPVLVSIKNNEEVPPLHEAVKNRRLDIVKVLLENGANVNDYDLDLKNVLHLAASNTDYEIIEYLLNESEVDARAQNRDEMNPLCLLLVRSRNENQDLVSRCFFLMLEHSYDKHPLTGTYNISDVFQCAFLACVYSHNEVVKFLIHNIYSVHNSKYEFIKKLVEVCDGDNVEFLYYILVFLHDDIDRYDKYSFPRFAEINYYMCIRSIIYVLEQLLTLSVIDAVETILKVLEHMKTIGFVLRVREFEDQVGVLLFEKFSLRRVDGEDLQKIDGIFRYLLTNKFKLNMIVQSYLHSVAVSRDSQEINAESVQEVLKILLYYSTSFFVELDLWKMIDDFKRLNPKIHQIVLWLLTNYGNVRLNAFLDVNIVFSLKHICRNTIRKKLRYNTKILCAHDRLATLGLPEPMIKYIELKE